MADPALALFIRDALGRGESRERVAAVLAEAGWPADTVRDALASYAEVAFPVPVPRPRPYLSAREAFLTIVLFIALGMTVTNLGVLLFQFVNIALPDPAASDYALRTVASRMRWSVSALIVAFPLFLWLSVRMERERRANPALRNSLIRKWLTYIALVIAASVIMGDLMTAIYQFLAGDMTLRFALKVVIIGLIAGTTFLHYIGTVEETGAEEAR